MRPAGRNGSPAVDDRGSTQETYRTYRPGLLNDLGKWAAPWLGRLLRPRRVAETVRMLETYLAFLQGKGAGSGWDLQTEVAVAVAQISRPDPVVLDVGANDGEWSEHLLAALCRRCRIIQFEPSPACLEALRARQSAQCTIIDAAVSDRPGTAMLYGLGFGSRFASIHPRRDTFVGGRTYTQAPVRVVTIDQVLDELEIETVDFMKLDIEGNELAALRGAGSSLASKRIKALSFEFGSGNVNSRTFFHDFWDLLQPLGYTIQRICPGGRLRAVPEYYEDLEYFRGVSYYLALLDGRHEVLRPAGRDERRDARELRRARRGRVALEKSCEAEGSPGD